MPPHISYHLISPNITISPQIIPAHIIPPHVTSCHLILHHPTSLILYFTPLHHTRLHPITSHCSAVQRSALLTNPPIPVSIPPSLRTVWYFISSDSPLLSHLSFLPFSLCLLSYLICIPPLTSPLLPSIPPITPPLPLLPSSPLLPSPLLFSPIPLCSVAAIHPTLQSTARRRRATWYAPANCLSFLPSVRLFYVSI